MAREIKYFNGSNNGTFYTVPAGRTAKVTLNYIDVPTGEVFYVGGVTALSGGITVGFPVTDIESTATSVVSPGANQSVAYWSNQSKPVIVTTTWYIGAGATVSSTNNGSGSIIYNFLVIEEY